MARTTVTPTTPSITGTALDYTEPTAEGDLVTRGTVLLIKNDGVAPITVTLITGASAGDYAIADPTVVIEDGEEMAIGPFSALFPQQSGAEAGLIEVNYSDVTSVTRAALTVPS